MNAVAIIPARGGSKRLPRKNIALVNGKPLIAWAIEAAMESASIGRGNVYVSTDDAQIADAAAQYGAHLIHRPTELAQDHVWTEPVIQHAVETVEANGAPIDVVVWMNACAPEVTAQDIDAAVTRLQRENLREVFSVDARLRSTSIVRALRRETLNQQRLSVSCGVMILDYVDVHYAADLAKVEARLQARAANGVTLQLDDSGWSHKAWMSEMDAELLERIILRQGAACLASAAQNAGGVLHVLEWGAGRSTLYLTEILRAHNLPFHWTALEYDRAYFERDLALKLAQRPATRISYFEEQRSTNGADSSDLEIVLFDKGPVMPFLAGHTADRQTQMDDYVAYPRGLGKTFDVIFVDGRKRRRCLLEAAGLLKARGVAVLHDAYRAHYHCAFPAFRSQRMLGEILWVGSQAETNFLEWIL